MGYRKFDYTFVLRTFFLQPNLTMRKGILILLFNFLAINAHSQDTCSRRPYWPINILSNPSFENSLTSCASGYQNVPFWFTPTSEMPTSFLNACDNFQIANPTMIAYSFTNPNICLYPIVPQPIPDGNGVAAVSDFGYGGAPYVYPFLKSYVSTCLTSILQKDSLYKLDFYVGFGDKGTEFLQVHNQLLVPEYSQSPETFTLFGLPDCSSIAVSLPIVGCASRAGWIPLGSCTVSSDTGAWVKATITFSPRQSVAAIALGPGCDTTYVLHPDVYTHEDKRVSSLQYSYFLDKLQFYTTTVPEPVISLVSGNSCSASVVLMMEPAAFYSGSALQWYKNDIALPGEQNNTITIARNKYGEGAYRCGVHNDSVCLVSDTLKVVWQPLPGSSILGSPDTTACVGDTVLLNGSGDTTFTYRWQNGSSLPTIAVTQSGTYSVSISNQCLTTKAEKTIHFTKCDLPVYVPNAFTPNGDGHNDVFRVHYYSLPSHFTMRLYKRNGAEVFYTSDPSQGWDGSLNGTLQPTGTYVWAIEYLDRKSITHKLKGTVVLIR